MCLSSFLQLLLIETHKPSIHHSPDSLLIAITQKSTLELYELLQNAQEILAVSTVRGKQVGVSQNITHEFHRSDKPSAHLPMISGRWDWS
jgi:hypothetical protein